MQYQKACLLHRVEEIFLVLLQIQLNLILNGWTNLIEREFKIVQFLDLSQEVEDIYYPLFCANHAFKKEKQGQF